MTKKNNDITKPTAVILIKGDMTACMRIDKIPFLGPEMNLLGKYDPRVKSSYQDQIHGRAAAVKHFSNNVKISVERGWTVVYHGVPNFG